MAKQPEEDDLSDLDLPEDENEEFDEEDLFADEDDLFAEEENAETAAPTQVEEAPPQESPAPAKAAAPAKEAKPRLIAAEQIPVTLVIEVGQVQMTMDQLMKLEPGNLLEISIHPENGVDLTINGKVVGKGELIRMGEAIGVRILELGV